MKIISRRNHSSDPRIEFVFEFKENILDAYQRTLIHRNRLMLSVNLWFACNHLKLLSITKMHDILDRLECFVIWRIFFWVTGQTIFSMKNYLHWLSVEKFLIQAFNSCLISATSWNGLKSTTGNAEIKSLIRHYIHLSNLNIFTLDAILLRVTDAAVKELSDNCRDLQYLRLTCDNNLTKDVLAYCIACIDFAF